MTERGEAIDHTNGLHSKAVRPMRPRDPHERHRVATPLELLFDLCFVVAVAQAASHLHHALSHGDFGHALSAYALVFFPVWWAWMNFTWFASAYDVDDLPYRLKALLQIAGVLVLAAGVPRAFEQQDFVLVTIGFCIMRVALIAQWLRAARADASRRRTALRYALGLFVCQLGWVSLLFIPHQLWVPGFFFLAPAELSVPIWAERTGATPWHAHHIAERYGLLTLIVLGESVLSATVAIQSALDEGHFSLELGGVIAGGLLLLFSMWWLYFDHPARHLHVTGKAAFAWGYGHLFIFGAVAAVGAGLAVATDLATGHAKLDGFAPRAAVTLPVALFVALTWALQIRPTRGAAHGIGFLVGVVLLLLASFSQFAVLWAGLVTAGLVGLCVLEPGRHAAH